MKLPDIFNSALDYTSYRNLVNQLISEGKTTGNKQSEQLLEFTKLNVQRMNRIDKTLYISVEQEKRLNESERNFNWLLIGDAWCGDCAQIIPVINKIAEATKGKVILKIISRDAYPQLLKEYHTNGSESIPKLLILCCETNELVCTWGPRPEPAQKIMLNWKNSNGNIFWDDFEKELHLWYARDKSQTILSEIIELLEVCERKTILQP